MLCLPLVTTELITTETTTLSRALVEVKGTYRYDINHDIRGHKMYNMDGITEIS